MRCRFAMQELITGGDLFSYVDSHADGRLSDAESAVIVRQLLEAITYLHEHGVVHRDIKPENILMTSLKRGSRIVLTDFGHAHQMSTSQVFGNPGVRHRMHTNVGTFEYSAPYLAFSHPIAPFEY